MADKKKESGINSEMAITAVLVVLIFLGAFYFFSSQVREYQVHGLKVLSKGEPYAQMSQILSPIRLAAKQVLVPGEDNRNSFIGLVSAEIIYSLGMVGKNVSVFAYVPEETNESARFIGCAIENNNCQSQQIVFQLDDCNCLRVQDGIIQVLYSMEKLKDKSLRVQLRGVIAGAAQGKALEQVSAVSPTIATSPSIVANAGNWNLTFNMSVSKT